MAVPSPAKCVEILAIWTRVSAMAPETMAAKDPMPPLNWSGFFVPWALTPCRQWDRTLNGIAVMIIVIATLSLGAALIRRWEAVSNAALAVPFLLLTAFGVGVIVVHVRLRVTEKPPAVDVASLTPSDIEVLRKVRQRALKILRHRNIVAYKDFNGYDNAPFDTAPGAAEGRS